MSPVPLDSLSTDGDHLGNVANKMARRRERERVRFSRATRRVPLLIFWLFLTVTVLAAGFLAHSLRSWNEFWHKDAVIDRSVVRRWRIVALLDALASNINIVLIRGGWIVAVSTLIAVQICYVALAVGKRQRSPALRFMRTVRLSSIVVVEAVVLLAATLYFLVATFFFNWLSVRLGHCLTHEGRVLYFVSREECGEGQFHGFDISGHCFLIVHSCLMLLEYLAKLLYVAQCSERAAVTTAIAGDKDSDLESSASSIVDCSNDALPPVVADLYSRNRRVFSSATVILTILTLFICVAESLVFLQTILFYHTLNEKLLGTVIGAGFWLAMSFLSLKYPHLF